MIDACVHPVVPSADDINAYLPREYRSQRLNSPGAGLYPVPIDDYVPGSYPSERLAGARSGPKPLPVAHAGIDEGGEAFLPGSHPDLMRSAVLDGPGSEYAVLLPLGRGLLAEPRFAAAVDTATNEWLAETWLGEWNVEGRFKGSIRVSPRSPEDAIKEIKRWADHPDFVQVVVPLEAHLTYGEQHYYGIWKAAASCDLPVCIHSDNNGGALLPPTSQGYPLTALEAYSQQPLYAVAHVASLIGHGVFDRLKSLMFVFADGGFDYMETIMWRLDGDWRSARAEVPWLRGAPSGYLPSNIRYVVHASDGMTDPDELARFIELNELGGVLMYGSNYPHWDYLPVSELGPSLKPELRTRIVDTNARELYRLPADAGVGHD